MKSFAELRENRIDEGIKITSVRAKKGQWVFGKDEKKDVSVVTYKGKVISTGDFDQGADAWFMNITGEKGQRSFDQPEDVVNYFSKNKITESKKDDEIEMFAWVRDKVHNSKGNTKHSKLKIAFTKMFGNAATKKHWDDMVTIAMDESAELEEAKEVSLSKKGEYNLVANGKTSSGIMLSLKYNGKQITTGTKKDGMFIMAFDAKFVKDNKLDSGAKIVKKGKWTHVGFKKADDVIAYAVLGGLSESLDEAVSVDMRTKGYKEAIARGLLRAQKKEKKTEIDKTLEDANKALTGKNEDMTAAGSDATGPIDGKDMPLKKIKRFKDA